MQNEALGQIDPLLLRYERLEVGGDALGIACHRQTQSVGEPAHMSVDCNPRSQTEGLAEHHLCGLPTDPREADQLIQITGNYFSKFGGDSTSCFPKAPTSSSAPSSRHI